nr:MAG TPA: hypothetical protein [Caudoviricetes sp.]
MLYNTIIYYTPIHTQNINTISKLSKLIHNIKSV